MIIRRQLDWQLAWALLGIQLLKCGYERVGTTTLASEEYGNQGHRYLRVKSLNGLMFYNSYARLKCP